MAEVNDVVNSKKEAKQMWKALQRLIKDRKYEINKRRRHAFDLFKCEELTSGADQIYGYKWSRYYNTESPQYCLDIRQRTRSVNWNDAVGFDNTGNICIWPSEEILAHYCIKNALQFREKRVCELGAGMTGLAGFMLALSSPAQQLLITDGNIESVQNLESITEANEGKFGQTPVSNRLLNWTDQYDYMKFEDYFDYIICADCLFYKESHSSLLQVMFTILKANGTVIIFAPHRGNSVDVFKEKAAEKFDILEVIKFDEQICLKYLQLKQMSPNNEEIKNFPVLLKLTKKL